MRYRGVTRAGRKWAASIRIDGRTTHIGYFDSAFVAARAYDLIARYYSSRLNFKE